MKKALVLILVLIFISGCALLGREVKLEANNGLKINEFSADPLEAEYNDPVFFSVDIENVGGTTAKNVEVTLYGIKKIWRDDATDSNTISNDPVEDDIDEMKPPDLVFNTPGDLEIVTWTYYPPALPEGVLVTAPVTARVTYEYSTTGTISIPAYSKSYYRINKGELDTSAAVYNTYAPIQIALSKGTTPIIVDDSLSGDEDATFIIEFINVGDGWPIPPDEEGVQEIGRFIEGEITILGDAEFSKCLDATGGKTAYIEDVDYAKFRTNGRLPIGCSIEIDRDDWKVTTTGNIVFRIDMEYRYYIEKTVNIQVQGTKEFEPTDEDRDEEDEEEEEDEDKPVIELLAPSEDQWLHEDFVLEVEFKGNPDETARLTKCQYKKLTDDGWSTLSMRTERPDDEGHSQGDTCENMFGTVLYAYVKIDSLRISQGEDRYPITLIAENEDGERTTLSPRFDLDWTPPSIDTIDHDDGTNTYEVDVYDEHSGLRSDSCKFYTSFDTDDKSGMHISDTPCKESDDKCTAEASYTATDSFTAYVECTDKAGNRGEEDTEIIICTSTDYSDCGECLKTQVTGNKCAWFEWSTKDSYCHYKSDYDRRDDCAATDDCERFLNSDDCP